jgi:hypothetical protein
VPIREPATCAAMGRVKQTAVATGPIPCSLVELDRPKNVSTVIVPSSVTFATFADWASPQPVSQRITR